MASKDKKSPKRPAATHDGTIAVYPGSFDPPTNGHLDIIARAAKLFGKVIVVVGVSDEKKSNSLFSASERVTMLEKLCGSMNKVEVTSHAGLTAPFAKSELGATAIVRGLRSGQDYNYEMTMSAMNRHLGKNIETVFLPTDPAYFHVSSTLVKEVARLGGDLKGLCPPLVLQKLAEKLKD